MQERVLSIGREAIMLCGMETLGERIKREMDGCRPPLKGYQLAQRLDRQQSYVSKLVNDGLKETPPPDVLRGLERELGIPVAWSLRALGYLPGEDDASITPDLPPGSNRAELAALLPDLSEAWAGALLRLLRDLGGMPLDEHGQRATPEPSRIRAYRGTGSG